ncbi:MAG: serine/threonine protein kinase [Gemmatales bacterium]|nr:serine/threonine protein kinase [Gemmatales bacterium]MDW8387807.1 serine/threonine-protein kinase [Gemmatales bacterium]
MTPSPPTQPDPQREARLAAVLDQLVELARSGSADQFENVLRQHPDLADELQDLWPAVQIAEHLAKPNPPDLSESDSPSRTSNALALPMRIGDYDLLEEVGRGGMAVVYEARHRSLGRIVALKMLLDPQLVGEDDRRRFRSEAKAAARLDHPNIVPVYETGELDGRPYISMKFIEGPTLAQLAADVPLPVRQAARYILKVAEAVHHAHRHGILHRDLKPSNVLVDKDDQPHVTDFGLAKRVPPASAEWASALSGNEGQHSAWRSSLTQAGSILGTPSYMPPEQATAGHGDLSPASDVYSLGAMLYYLLTSRPPFQASNPVDVLLQVLERDPLPPHLLNPNVDADLEAICLKALQKRPGLRYATAAELAADLRAYLDGHPVTARSRNLGDFLKSLLFPHGSPKPIGLPKSLWLVGGAAVLALGGASAAMLQAGITSRWPHLLAGMAVFLGAVGILGVLLRRQGPIPAEGWQTLQVWLTAVFAAGAVFVIEWLLDLPIFRLLPILSVIAGMMFMIHAGSLSARFYPAAGGCFVAAMALPWLEGPSAVLFLAALVAAGLLLAALPKRKRSTPVL